MEREGEGGRDRKREGWGGIGKGRDREVNSWVGCNRVDEEG